jgi:A/G-specific adenine glycosylase
MELGALVCTARGPDCGRCPIVGLCAWVRAGRPGDAHAHRRRAQPWQGTDRQCRGRIMAALRDADAPMPPGVFFDGVAPDDQVARCLAALVADGLAAITDGAYHLAQR